MPAASMLLPRQPSRKGMKSLRIFQGHRGFSFIPTQPDVEAVKAAVADEAPRLEA